ncbi:hypothetical protein FSP39_010853, partial [Pinctada imbricata]
LYFPASTLHTGLCLTRLGINGTHFTFGGQRVFLSGVNKAWESYAYDFGQQQYQYRRQAYQKFFQETAQAGGNSVRIWIHMEGETSPQFDSSGHVIGTDANGTLINDLRTMIQDAKQQNILVFLCLWNAAVKQSFHKRLDGLIKDTNKLQSYINNALVPMVQALKNETALGGWDIINEPAGEMMSDVQSSDPCQDTTFLKNSGAGWAGSLYKAVEFQRFYNFLFVNWQADAIKRSDPAALVTVGTWSGRPVLEKFGWKNIYKDICLVKAGNKPNHDFSELGLDKPVVIGEFRESDGGGMTINQLYDHAYFKGYTGAWGWSQMDGNMQNLMQGMTHVRNYNDSSKGGVVKITL